MGVNTQQNDYYESLFRRTTASYRAKIYQENDKRGPAKRKSLDTEPSSSRQAAAANRKILSERNHGETSTSSNELLSSVHSSKSQAERKAKEVKPDKKSIKTLIEKILAQVLNDRRSPEFVDNDQNYISKENSPIRSIVEEVLKEKLSDLRHTSRHNKHLKSSEPESLRLIVEDIVIQVLEEKLSRLQNQNEKSEDRHDVVKNLNRDLQQKLTISKEQDIILPREPVTHYNYNGPLDSQSLVQQLLNFEGEDNNSRQKKILKKPKADRDNSNNSHTTGCIKRLHRSPMKKSEWQDPSVHDKALDKACKAIRSQSPAVSSSARSGHSKYSSSVLIRRSKSQGRKPKSDPVALYHYYKNEWEHFRKQIPGETSHGRLRWHVRQRLLDPE